MITQPNMNLLSALAPAAAPQAVPVIGSASAQNLRFDAVLLEAAKVVRDGSGPEVGTTLTPKVEHALESLLDQLAQQPVENLRQWASQPDGLKPAVQALAQAQGLDPEETASLVKLAPLASKSLVQAYESAKEVIVNTANTATPGISSGPQGREPGTTVDPAKTFEPSAPRALKDERSTELPATLAQAIAWAPVMAVSTRTDVGTGADSSLSLSSQPIAPAAAPVANGPAPVIVNVSDPQAAPSPLAAAVPVAAPQSPSAVSVSLPSENAFQASEASPVQSASPAPRQATTVSAPRASAGSKTEAVPAAAEELSAAIVQSAPSTAPVAETRSSVSTNAAAPQAVRNEAPTKNAVEASLDFKIGNAPTNSPRTVVDESTLFVVNSDGSSQGVQQVSKPTADEPQAVQAQPQAPQGVKAETALPQAFRPEATFQAPSTASAAPTAVPAPAPATTQAPIAASAPVVAQPAGPSFSPTIPQAASSSTVVTTPAPAEAPTTVPMQAVQAVPVQSVDAAGPQGASPKASSTDAPDAPSRSFEPLALQNSAGFQSLTRSQHDDAPQSGMAFGQETLRHLVTQVARELGIREAAFTQVSDALANAGVKETSRLTIKLKPASLGEVQVDLSVDGGKLNARLIASTPEVRDAFVRDLPAFKAGLEAQGLKIDQLSVAVRAESQFNPQGQSQPQQQPQPQDVWRNMASVPAGPDTAPSTFSAWSSPALNDQLFSALA